MSVVEFPKGLQSVPTVDHALRAAASHNYKNVIILSVEDDNSFWMTCTDNLTDAQVVWLLERAKIKILSPSSFQRVEDGPTSPKEGA